MVIACVLHCVSQGLRTKPCWGVAGCVFQNVATEGAGWPELGPKLDMYGMGLGPWDGHRFGSGSVIPELISTR